LFFEVPGGIMFELAHKGPAGWKAPIIGLTGWDLCQNTSHGVLPPAA
jgi:hypothetical protein